MKILIIQPRIRLGSSEMVSVNLAAKLVRQGHELDVACAFMDPEGTPCQASQLRYLLPPGNRVAPGLSPLEVSAFRSRMATSMP